MICSRAGAAAGAALGAGTVPAGVFPASVRKNEAEDVDGVMETEEAAATAAGTLRDSACARASAWLMER